MQPEAIFRTYLIAHLKKHHVKTWRLEPNFRGVWGVPDIWAFSPRMNKGYFIEVKRPGWKGELKGEQLDFQRLCDKCNVNHLIVSCVEDVDCIIPKANSSLYSHIKDWYRKHPELK